MKNQVSVSIAIKGRENYSSLKACLFALEKQTYKNFEVILVGDRELKNFKFKFKDHRIAFDKLIISGDKNEARNAGFSKAKGKYFLYLDHDMRAQENLLESCLKSSKKFDAIIIPEKGEGGNFLANCRKLERELIAYDLDTVTPRFFKHSIIDRGELPFDKRFGLLDEWGFNIKIKNKRVSTGIAKSYLLVSDTNASVKASVKNKFQRGLWMKNFQSIDSQEAWRRIDPIKRGVIFYAKNIHYLLKDPLHFIALMALKLIDMTAFLAGYMIAILSFKNLFGREIIQTYDNFGNVGENYSKMYEGRNWNRYVDKEEKQLIKALWNLDSDRSLNKQKILDLGMGPGRWSKFFLGFNFQSVTGLDISPEMVKYSEGLIRDQRFRSVLGNMNNLKFPNSSYDKLFCFRALKYVPEYRAALKEMNRVLAKNGRMIIEVPNMSILNRFLRFLSAIVLIINSNSSMNTRWGYFSNVHFFSKKEICKLVEKNNLKVMSITPLFVLPSIRFPSILDRYFTKPIIFIDKIAVKTLPAENFARSWVILAKK